MPGIPSLSTKGTDFDEVQIRLASPEQIKEWSHGEVIKPETINYRTQKPEKDGLFSEEIFGPTKDWECYCGKYKRIRYKGIICEKCGVEVTRSIVRRERMGHIELAVPVTHIWCLRGVPSKVGLILDLSILDLEKVVYFAAYIVTEVDEKAREEALKQIQQEFKAKKSEIEGKYKQFREQLQIKHTARLAKASGASEKKAADKERAEEDERFNAEQKTEIDNLSEALDTAKRELKGLQRLQVISELEYRDLSVKYGHVFSAGIGAEALRNLVAKTELTKLASDIEVELKTVVTSKRRKLKRRLKLAKSMIKAGIRPEWMFLTVLPVLPPDLRPMVQLDGGRFAASDLNDLYRRVINRNNRLKRLLKLNAPEVITRNEKRMLQEAVDALIDNNARRGKAVASATGQKRTLKSLADMLKGKQGRFRQNLLGKRVDYSGRSVIVVGPKLKLHQCGLPKKMALELFKPFVIGQLIKHEYAYNVRSAGKLIEQGRPEVWDMLDKVIKGQYVLLNRAPTLHRLGIQAFEPMLIEGKAIQVHPLVCEAFNADFDGDQMAVHVPLTRAAQIEAKEIMLSARNMIKPATGDPIAQPRMDMVLGCYWTTRVDAAKDPKKIKHFDSVDEVLIARATGAITYQDEIKILLADKWIATCAGRVAFNQLLPKKLQFVNKQIDKKEIKKIMASSLDMFGMEQTAELADRIKDFGFEQLTASGLSWGMADIERPEGKDQLIKKAEDETEQIHQHYKQGLLTDEERRLKTIELWQGVRDKIADLAQAKLKKMNNSVYMMVTSGARGNPAQVAQMMGMKGLVANPAGETIELPIKHSFKEGLGVLEYFIGTHGARKGMSDTALRTANAGYLTRRLVDVSQDVVITSEDCKTKEGIVITLADTESMGLELAQRVWGRVLASKVIDSKTGEVIAKAGTLIDKILVEKIRAAKPDSIRIRSPLSCEDDNGLCQLCYGYDLGRNKLVELGQAVGIVAAQAIGEPGTQLTMRTFHSGGVAASDITQGLPRVEELFEARPIKKPAIIAEIGGKVEITEESKRERVIRITSTEVIVDPYPLTDKAKIIVKAKDYVERDADLASESGKKIKARYAGIVKKIEPGKQLLIAREGSNEKIYRVPVSLPLWVKNGELVEKGQQLTEGSIDLFELFRVSGTEAVQRYIIREIQNMYSTQGQPLNDKHVEIIVRQMLLRKMVREAGESDLLEGDLIDKNRLRHVNAELKAGGKRPIIADDLLQGITKASLSTDSFLSAASFQQTARVLIDAAITGRTDTLKGLKENVIIGRVIPAGTGFKYYAAKFGIKLSPEVQASLTDESALATATVAQGSNIPIIAPPGTTPSAQTMHEDEF
ncbi:MAG: DNA-directed RNA polymerase subunit beta' [Parcubacteria group bacterium]